MRLARYLCWLLGTSVRKTRRFLRTDVPSSQHSEIVPVHFASYRGHSVPCDQSRSLPHESSAFDGKGKCRLTIGNRVAQSNQKGTHEAQSEVVHASPKVSGNGTTLCIFCIRQRNNFIYRRTTLFIFYNTSVDAELSCPPLWN